jgi:oligopeptidase A
LTAFWTRFGQNPALHAQYQRLASAPAFADTDPVRRRVVEHVLRDFRLSGIALADADKARFGDIQQELSALSAKFAEHVLDATDAYAMYVDDEHALAGVPSEVIEACRAAAAREGRTGYRLGLQMPCYLPVQTYAENRELRRTLYLANIIRASGLGPAEHDNEPLIRRIIALRTELASLLGFSNYAEYSLATKMADTPQQVLAFLQDLARHARPYARLERAELEVFACDALGLDALEPWDLAWASEKLKQERYSFSQQEVKRYFTEPKVLAGLFGVIQMLYGLRFEADQAPTWHPDVRFYRLVDGDGRVLGHCYLDLYAREGKRAGAWMDVCRNRYRRDETLQTPVVYLVCNFGRGADGQPATFNHSEVVTLFHEMGHGLHQLLTEVDEPQLAGIHGVEWDAVELPSQFMENFCWEWPYMRGMTAHVETGNPLPHALFERMLAARNFQAGMATLRQLEFALFDMQLHSSFNPATDSALALHRQVHDDIAVNPAPESDRFPCQFSHVFAGGYAAGYYSYKWAEVLSADAYEAFAATPKEVAKIGARFRREVLSRGGSRPAIENFRAFRGRDPDVSALLKLRGMAT